MPKFLVYVELTRLSHKPFKPDGSIISPGFNKNINIPFKSYASFLPPNFVLIFICVRLTDGVARFYLQILLTPMPRPGFELVSVSRVASNSRDRLSYTAAASNAS